MLHPACLERWLYSDWRSMICMEACGELSSRHGKTWMSYVSALSCTTTMVSLMPCVCACVCASCCQMYHAVCCACGWRLPPLRTTYSPLFFQAKSAKEGHNMQAEQVLFLFMRFLLSPCAAPAPWRTPCFCRLTRNDAPLIECGTAQFHMMPRFDIRDV